MIMKREQSDWCFPRDWILILSWYFVILPMALFAGFFLSALSAARRGDPAMLYFGLALSIIGVVLLFFARLPHYRQRKFFSVGPRELPYGHRKLYWTAYGFIGVAVAIMVLLFMVLK
jgi:hypothetical protein